MCRALQNELTSRQHPIVKRFRRSPPRRSERAARCCSTANTSLPKRSRRGVRIDTVLIDGRRTAVARRARAAGATCTKPRPACSTPPAPCSTAERRRRDRASGQPRARADGLAADGRTAPLVLGLVDVQDPGNVGSVIRGARRARRQRRPRARRTADPGGWKALRGAMGSTFRVPIARGSSRDAVTEAKRRRPGDRRRRGERRIADS